jgi:hypothetical protein
VPRTTFSAGPPLAGVLESCAWPTGYAAPRNQQGDGKTTPTNQFPRETSGLPPTSATATVELADGDRFPLRIGPVSKRIQLASDERATRVGRFSPATRIREGDTIDVAVEESALHFFDPSTGEAIYDHAADRVAFS